MVICYEPPKTVALVPSTGHFEYSCVFVSKGRINSACFYAKSSFPGHYTYLNSRFCNTFTSDSTQDEMSRNIGKGHRVPSCVVNWGSHKNRWALTGPITSSRSAVMTVKKYGSAFFNFFYSFWCPFDANNNSRYLFFCNASIASNRCTGWFKFCKKM